MDRSKPTPARMKGHDRRPRFSKAVLLKSAIDEEVGPLFERQILPSPDVAPALMRAAASLNDDEFDSQIFEVFHWCSKWSLRHERSRGSAVRMQRAKRFIGQNALEQVGLKDIADAVGLNPFVCVRQFKQATGMTPYAYLVHRRMLEAKRLLRETNRSIEDVAKLTGFNDFPYFSRSFKRSTGVTPTQYRVGWYKERLGLDDSTTIGAIRSAGSHEVPARRRRGARYIHIQSRSRRVHVNANLR